MTYELVTLRDGQETSRQPLPVDNSRQAENLARIAARRYTLEDGFSARFHFTARTWTLTKGDTEVLLKVVEVN